MIPVAWRARLAVAAVLYLVLEVLLTTFGFEPDALRLALVVAVLIALYGVVQDALGDSGPGWDVESGGAVLAEGLDRPTARYVGLLESHLTSRAPDGLLAARLRALADTVLRQRHGLSVSDAGARDLLGPELVRILDEPRRRLSRDEIDRCVTRIEEL